MAEMTIRRFSVFSVARMQGLLGFAIGLFIGVIYGLFFMLFGAAMSTLVPQEQQAMGGASSVVIGIIIMIAVPVFYGILGFIGGAIGALVYNLAAGVVGGIRVELEGMAPDYVPPPPQRWSAA